MKLSDEQNNKLKAENKVDQYDEHSDLEKVVRTSIEDNKPVSLSKQSSDTDAYKSFDSKYAQTELNIKTVKPTPFEVDQDPKKETNGNKIQKNFKKKQTKGNATPSQYSPVIPPGILLEYRIKRLVFNLGYYPRMGIDLKTSYDEAADKITDLDVYGIYVHKDFTTKTLWADCKSGGVRIHDRLSWIKGVMGTIQINDVLLVAGGVRTSVKHHARKSGIQILDLNIIGKLEEDYGVKVDDWRGSWNPKNQFNKILNLSRVSIPTNDLYKKIAKFISSDYWVM